MVRLFVLSFVSMFSMNAFAAEKLECQVRDRPEQNTSLSIFIDGNSATVKAPNTPDSSCKRLSDQKDIAEVEKELNAEFKDEKLSIKTLVVCEGRTGDETLAYIVLGGTVTNFNVNTLVMSPVIGLVAGGTCK
jgi:hypothetical protein